MAVDLSWDRNAACRTVGSAIWGAIEKSVEECLIQYEGRTKRRRAYNMAMPALRMCQTCPVFEQCLDWAKDSNYSGIAGGQILTNGRTLTPPGKKVKSV